MPFHSREWRLMLATSIRKASGTSKVLSTSAVFSVSAKPRLHARDHRHDAIAERRHVEIEIADRLDMRARQGRSPPPPRATPRAAGLVGLVDLAAGKRDLPRMVGQMLRALRQQHRRLGAIDHRRPARRPGGSAAPRRSSPSPDRRRDRRARGVTLGSVRPGGARASAARARGQRIRPRVKRGGVRHVRASGELPHGARPRPSQKTRRPRRRRTCACRRCRALRRARRGRRTARASTLAHRSRRTCR